MCVHFFVSMLYISEILHVWHAYHHMTGHTGSWAHDAAEDDDSFAAYLRHFIAAAGLGDVDVLGSLDGKQLALHQAMLKNGKDVGRGMASYGVNLCKYIKIFMYIYIYIL